MTPGATAFTRTPNDAHSKARVLVRLSTPERAAPVCAIMGKPFHICAIILTIFPCPCDENALVSIFWLIKKVPVRLVSMTAFQPFLLIDRKSTRLNSSHVAISYAAVCLQKQ